MYDHIGVTSNGFSPQNLSIRVRGVDHTHHQFLVIVLLAQPDLAIRKCCCTPIRGPVGRPGWPMGLPGARLSAAGWL